MVEMDGPGGGKAEAEMSRAPVYKWLFIDSRSEEMGDTVQL